MSDKKPEIRVFSAEWWRQWRLEIASRQLDEDVMRKLRRTVRKGGRRGQRN